MDCFASLAMTNPVIARSPKGDEAIQKLDPLFEITRPGPLKLICAPRVIRTR